MIFRIIRFIIDEMRNSTKIQRILLMPLMLIAVLLPEAAFCQDSGDAGKKVDQKAIMGCLAPLRQRMEKDHRLRLIEDKYRGTPRIHAYLVTANQTLPYLISLGWLRTTDTIQLQPRKEKKRSFVPKLKFKIPGRKKSGDKEEKEEKEDINQKNKNLLDFAKNKFLGLNVVDENNFVIPSLTEEPLDSASKIDIVFLSAFDALIEKKMDKAEKLLRQTIDEDPDDEKFQNAYGVVLALKGEYKKAAEHISKAIELNDHYYFALNNRALLYLARGKPKEALVDADACLNAMPNFHPAEIARARALLESGGKEEALKIATELKQKYSADWQTMLLLADAQLVNENFKEAKETLTRLSVLSPNNWDLLLKLAHAANQVGDLNAAILYARKATITGGNDASTHLALGNYLKDNQDSNAAILQYERALDLKPSAALRKQAMAAVLSIYAREEKWEQCLEIASKWTDKFPDDSFTHFNKAWIASKMDGIEYRDIAISEYEEAIARDKNLSSAKYNLALLLINANKNEEAVKQLTEFVKSCPDDSDADHARELLSKLKAPAK